MRQDLLINPWWGCFAVTKHLLNITERDGGSQDVLMPLPLRFETKG